MYLAERVDPLMSNIISYLLAEQPTHADEAILKYLEGKKNGLTPRPKSAKRHNGDSSRNALLKDRLYMGRKVQPVLEKLMRRVVEEQPVDVESHFIKQLKRAIAEKQANGDSDPESNDVSDKGKNSPQQKVHQRSSPTSAKDTESPDTANLASVEPPSRGACDALFRMLDEDGAGSMTAAQVVGRLAALHACGVPMDPTAQAFWSRVELSASGGKAGGPDTVFDRARFFHSMVRVAEAAEKWLPAGSARPKLSSVLPAAALKPAASKQPVAADAPLQPPKAGNPTRKVSSPPAATADTPLCVVLEVGAPVSVNYRKSGNYYKGKVSTVNNESYDVTYDDGDSEGKVKPAMITALDAKGEPLPVVVRAKAVASEASSHKVPPLSSAPSVVVGSRVEVKYKGGTGNWYKGKVTGLSESASSSSFNVEFDDGDKEVGVQLQHVKLLDSNTGLVVSCIGSAHDLAATATATATSGSPAAAPVPLKTTGVKPTVAIVGVSSAGKSVLLKAMGGDPEPKPRPTTGFTQKKMGFALPHGGGEVPVHWYDLPGQWTKKWDEYLAEAHAVVYVIDASAPEESEVEVEVVEAAGGPKKALAPTAKGFEHARSVFLDAALSRHVAGKPMLVLANKQDLQGARSAETVAAALGLDGDGGKANLVKVVGGSAHPLLNGGEFDGRVEAGLEWLLSECVLNFDDLSERVKAADEEAQLERAKEKVERARRVFTKVLKEKAFPPQGEEPLETFSEVDGFEFLAMELLIHDPQDAAKTRTAEEQWGLPEVAQRVCRLVGFQKMAMIMTADMINPEAKKNKETRSWDEVTAYVMDRREEAELPRDLP